MDRRRVVTVLAASALLPAVALTVFTASYQTNDDVVMRLLAEGNFVPGDEPLPYLMFINVIIGKILAIAYGITTAVPWYDLLLGGSMIASSAALVHVWAASGRKVEIIWALLFAAYFLLPTFVNVQFSFAGLACAAAGIGLLLRPAMNDLGLESSRRHLLLGVALFVWGSLIRFPGAVLMAIEATVLALPFVIGIVRNRSERPRLRGTFVAACVAVLLTVAGFGVNQFAYRQAPGWAVFHEYNILRLRLAEYISPERINAETTYALAKRVGWSRNDFALFSNWFFTDPQLFSLTRVRQAERLFYGESTAPAEDWRKVRMKRSVDLGVEFFNETRWAFLLMGVFVLAHGARPKLILYFAGMAATLGLLVVGISVTMKAPPLRIYWPMLILAATMVSLAAQRWGRPVHGAVRTAALALAVVVAALPLPDMKRESNARRVAAAATRADVEGLRRTGASMFFLHANAFPYEDFWTPLHTEKAVFDFVGLGVSARTPPVQDFLAKSGYGDIPWSLCTDSRTAIISAGYVPPMLTTFVKEHHNATVEFVESFEGRRMLAWTCRRVE